MPTCFAGHNQDLSPSTGAIKVLNLLSLLLCVLWALRWWSPWVLSLPRKPATASWSTNAVHTTFHPVSVATLQAHSQQLSLAQTHAVRAEGLCEHRSGEVQQTSLTQPSKHNNQARTAWPCKKFGETCATLQSRPRCHPHLPPSPNSLWQQRCHGRCDALADQQTPAGSSERHGDLQGQPASIRGFVGVLGQHALHALHSPAQRTAICNAMKWNGMKCHCSAAGGRKHLCSSCACDSHPTGPCALVPPSNRSQPCPAQRRRSREGAAR